MMKVIPAPSATIASVESGAEGERGVPEKDCVWPCGPEGGEALRCREQTHLFR